MWNGLEELLELQRLDQALARLQGEARQIPAQVAALEADLARAREAWEQAKGTAAALGQARRDRERDLEVAYANQRKRQGRLYEIKTNQEYSAVLKEIEQLKETVSDLETRILELMDEQEQAGRRVAEAEAAFRAAEATAQGQRAAREQDLARLQAEIADRQRARRRIAGTVDRELLQTYTRVMKIREGTAVVPLRDGSCGGCFVALPPQTCTEVRASDRRITCPYCQRILYSLSAEAPAGGEARPDAARP